MRKFNILFFLFVLCLFEALPQGYAETEVADAHTIVREAFEHWRDSTSIVEAEMTIHRPDWERTSSLRSYTKGNDLSLVRFLSPPKDAGNASLTRESVIWNYIPRINRTVKVPPSMMSQSWMGSDFSYRDLSREDSILEDYDLSIAGTDSRDGQKVFVILAVPKPGAPVVWGKEELRIRVDHIIVEHLFYDQDMKLIKKLETRSIGPLGGKTVPLVMRMNKKEAPEEWTEVRYRRGAFNTNIPESAFSLSNLARPHEPFLTALEDS